VNQNKDLPCICGHRTSKHNKSNGKHWERLNRKLVGYEDTPENRSKFWSEFLTSSTPDEFGCSECDCKGFKMDNLKFLEDEYKEKIK
jgi:hypothetical protein